LEAAVTSPAHRASAQLNQNNTFLVLKERINLLLPLFSQKLVIIVEWIDPIHKQLLQYPVDWEPNKLLYLQDIGISVPGGNIRFIVFDYSSSQKSSDATTI
jgi:hypothetical protein